MGRPFEDTFPALELRIERSQLSHVLETGEIDFVSAQLNIPGREYLFSTRMLLPLAANGQMILSLSEFH
jgi:hypothetical protein